MTIEQLLAMRQRQALKVANASRGRREFELAEYRKLENMVRLDESRSAPRSEGAAA